MDLLQSQETLDIEKIRHSRPTVVVSDMSRVTLNFDLSKIPFVRF